MSHNCIFCKIVGRSIISTILYEDARILAFEDTKPQAPIHILVIPKVHYSNILEAAEDMPLLGDMLTAVMRLAREKGIADDGFRTVINTGPNGGQTVYHLHIHLLGGRFFKWPPG